MVRFCAFGPLGSGKTLVLVKEAYRYRIKYPDNKIYSNVPLNRQVFGDSYVPIFEVSELFYMQEDCFILLDENWSIADSRNPNAPENKAENVILLRSRKKRWTVGTSVQWYTQNDLRLRFVTDIWILPQFYISNNILQEDIYDVFTNYLGTRYYDGSKFFDLYETEKDPTTLDVHRFAQEFEAKKNRALRGYNR